MSRPTVTEKIINLVKEPYNCDKIRKEINLSDSQIMLAVCNRIENLRDVYEQLQKTYGNQHIVEQFLNSMGSHVQYNVTPSYDNQYEDDMKNMDLFFQICKYVVDIIVEGNTLNDINPPENKCVIHIIEWLINRSFQPNDDDGEFDEIDEKDINLLIDKYYPKLWSQMKIGDLVEDVTHSGYRSTARYYVDENTYREEKLEINEDTRESNTNDWLIGRKLVVRKLYWHYDEYGSIPPHFYNITRFPLNYFNDIVVNNPYNILIVDNHEKSASFDKFKSSWHNGAILLDAEKLGLNNITSANIKTSETGDVNYIVFEYDNIKYAIGYETQYIDENEFLDIITTDTILLLNNYENGNEYISNTEHIEPEHIFIIEF